MMLDLKSDDQGQSSNLQRARGEAFVTLKQGAAGAAKLAGMRQSGSAKVLLPRVDGATEVVFLNTAGGVTGGDRFDFRFDLADGVRATATTQTAERAYASPGGPPGRISVRLSAGRGARLAWLPQETILFDRSDLERLTHIDLAQDATLLLCETVLLGRAAMGEVLTSVQFFDRREVRRAGQPVFLDQVALDAVRLKTGAAGLDGARAVSTVAFLTPGAEDAIGPVREILDQMEIEAAASAWDGRLIVRMKATDGWPLRRGLAAVLTQLHSNALPRVWQL